MPERPLSQKLAFWCLIILTITIVSSKIIKGPFYNPNRPQVLGVSWPEFKFASSFNFNFESSNLSKIIQNRLSPKQGHYSIYVENLVTKEQYGFNEREVFPAASLYKLFLIASVVEKIEQGEITEEDTVSSSKAHLEEVLGETDFGYENAPATIAYTVDEALTRVGRISDNFAAIMLAEKIGWDNIQLQAEKLDAKNTIIKSPISTTAADVATFFKKLYAGEIISASGSEKIIKYLSLNQLDNRLPAYLPEGIKIVHKTGELSRVRHDAGIVYCCNTEEEKKQDQNLNNQPYVIVVMSKNLEYEDDGVETIAELSKDIYNYFKNK